jgi:hypothetical protein
VASPTITSSLCRLCGQFTYDKWREYDAEGTVRFYALRLHEAGMIKSDPNTIIAKGTDRRFLNELKRTGHCARNGGFQREFRGAFDCSGSLR